MKKIIFSLSIISLVLVQACGEGRASSEKEGVKDSAKETSTKVEEKSATIHLTREEFLTKVIDFTKGPENMKYLGDKPSFVDFYADWCAPCRKAAPILEELAKEYEGRIYIYKVDTQKEQQLATELGIQGIPNFIFFPLDGKPFSTSGIARTDEETKRMFKDIIDKQLLKITQ